MQEKINIEALRSDLLNEIIDKQTGATAFETCRPLIQEAINRGASKRFIWQWLHTRSLYPFTYTTFLKNFKKQTIKKQSQAEIDAISEKNRLRSII